MRAHEEEFSSPLVNMSINNAYIRGSIQLGSSYALMAKRSVTDDAGKTVELYGMMMNASPGEDSDPSFDAVWSVGMDYASARGTIPGFVNVVPLAYSSTLSGLSDPSTASPVVKGVSINLLRVGTSTNYEQVTIHDTPLKVIGQGFPVGGTTIVAEATKSATVDPLTFIPTTSMPKDRLYAGVWYSIESSTGVSARLKWFNTKTSTIAPLNPHALGATEVTAHITEVTPVPLNHFGYLVTAGTTSVLVKNSDFVREMYTWINGGTQHGCSGSLSSSSATGCIFTLGTIDGIPKSTALHTGYDYCDAGKRCGVGGCFGEVDTASSELGMACTYNPVTKNFVAGKPPPTKKKSSKHKMVIIIIASVAVILIILAGFMMYRHRGVILTRFDGGRESSQSREASDQAAADRDDTLLDSLG